VAGEGVDEEFGGDLGGFGLGWIVHGVLCIVGR
jgi:hypothetical protein